MKSILINDFMSLFFKNKKYIIGYYGIIVVAIIMAYILKYDMNKELYYCILGLKFETSNDAFQTLLFLLNITVIVYVILYLFCNDLKNGLENIFLRLEVAKWIIYKIISIFLCLLFTRIVLYIIMSILLSIRIDLCQMFCTDILYFGCIESIVLTLYMISKKSRVASLLLLLITIFIIFYVQISVYFILRHKVPILCITLLLGIICYKLAKIVNTNLFEKA